MKKGIIAAMASAAAEVLKGVVSGAEHTIQHKGNYGFGFDGRRLRGKIKGPRGNSKYNVAYRSVPLRAWTPEQWAKRCQARRSHEAERMALQKSGARS